MLAKYRSLQESTAPAVEPLTLAEAKLHLHVPHDAEDAMITQMIVVARKAVEHATSTSLIETTWVQRMDSFPAGRELILARSPLSSVTSVAYVDTTGAAATMTVTTDYLLDIYTTPGRIYLAPGVSWPPTYGEPNDVTVTFVAGYGDASTDIPATFVQATKLALGDLYSFRERFVAGKPIEELPTFELMMLNEQAEFTF